MKKIFYSISLLTAVSASVLTSCSRDFTETQFFQSELATPITSVEQLESFLRGAYTKMRDDNYLGKGYRAYGEIHTDEMYCTQYSGRNVNFATYTLTSSYSDVKDTWYAIYQTIGNANIVINAPETLSWGGSTNAAAVKSQIRYIKGQAYAIRAQAFFDLLKLYGQEYSGGSLGVVLPTVYDPNAMQARSSVTETRAKIESDFANALVFMGDSGDTATKNQLNKNSVKALMSRYFLYKGDYTSAAKYADDVVDSRSYTVVPPSDFAASFLKDSPANSIFELSVGLNGALGTTSYDYLMNSNGYANIALLPSTLDLYEDKDIRNDVIEEDGEFYLNGKFASLTGSANVKVIRYEEVLLNGAEAHFRNGEVSKALVYYNQVRSNRGLDNASTITMADIKNERVRELVGEGFRYWDLLRWGDVIPYYTSQGVRDTSKDKNVGDHLLAFPIPRAETDVANTKVVSNPGYDN